MRNILKKPLFLAFLSALVLTISPFNIPPVPEAKASEFHRTVFKQAVTFKLVSVDPLPVERTPEASKAYAWTQLESHGWQSQWECLETLWTRESNWRPNARNSTAVWNGEEWVHAGGIPQILKLDPSLSVEIQIARGFKYIRFRYGTPCNALSYWSRNFSY